MNKNFIRFSLLIYACYSLYAQDLKTKKLYNTTAYISSQCYTKTVNDANENILHNPCFSCHTKNKEPNFTLSDDDLQEAYDFPEVALTNPWINLFKDRTSEVEKISDKEILDYVREDNYKNEDGSILLKTKLKNLKKEWDFNENGKWDGYTPDINFSFDNEGFDKDLDGSYTGWRAFAYHPFLGTFWPTNGSTDDVLIRLPKSFQSDINGNFNLEIYKLNLSIIESLIKQKSIKIDVTDEKLYGVDLNQDGKLNNSSIIVFNWKTPKYDLKTRKIYDYSMSYVGLAKKELLDGERHIAPGLYPVGTEFAHTVRYIDIENNGNIKMALRIKEFRYGKKKIWNTYSQLHDLGLSEIKEKYDFPDRVDVYLGNMEVGLSNKRGWYYQGFIEDSSGDLRPQTYEETLFCMGCHSNLGSTADSTFVFQRKLEKNSFANGWYHWTQKGLKGIPDKKLDNGQSEYIRYLKENSAGDEFRANEEIEDKFFIPNWKNDSENIEKDLIAKLENPEISLSQNWKFKTSELDKVKDDISYLILPSKKRALNLNKAYKVIVDEQSYIYGRDPHIKPASNVYKNIKKGQMTHLQKISQ